MALFSLNAYSAAWDLDQGTPLLYAEQALTRDELKNNGNLIVSSSADDLNIKVSAGFAISAEHRYVRIDLHNGVFEHALPGTGVVLSPDYHSVLSQGGAIGDSFAIIEISSATPTGQDVGLMLELQSLRFEDSSIPLGVRYAMYGDAASAVSQERPLVRKQADMLKVVDGVESSFAEAYVHKVGFGSDFLRFVPSFRSPGTFGLGDSDGDVASLAKFQGEWLIKTGVRKASDSSFIVDFRDLLPDVSTSTKDARLYVTSGADKLFFNDSDDCSGSRLAVTTEPASAEFQLSIDQLVTYPVLCLDQTDSKRRVARSEFRLNLGIGLDDAFFGKVTYDAASIDLPYVTTYSGYRQKLIIANHAGYDVSYLTTFLSEEAVAENYTPGTKSVGVIPAGGVLKLNADELVDIAPGAPSRVTARMFLDALPEDISAAIQIIALDSSAPPVTNILDVRRD
ncbi:hypothetical protein GCM10010982_00980 [Bowmanella pacifica]|uniref:Uncharacterized protein n=2 Tax=Bowmanella pacifica TaxID=502051 RepID=A0A917YSG5_9ALTE|nr:hypothetical protein GCM10010982_00980 [Bowmanella pacifica]